MHRRFALILCFMMWVFALGAQSGLNRFLMPSDSLNKKRLHQGIAFSALTYSAFSIGLYQAWYKNGDLGKFHFFNDLGEWKNMDKMGHVYDGYFQSDLCFRGAKWAGLSDRKAMWVGVGMANLFQTTIEVYDGYSNKWGFSWADISSNLIGSGFFLTQQLLWKEQRILLKFSSHVENYKNYNDDIQERVKALNGNSIGEKLLKDYNAQTYWISFNPSLFYSKSKWPAFLNFAVGYGANNLFGGYKNEWTNNQGNQIVLDKNIYPRGNEYYLSLDLNLTKIPVKNRFLKSTLYVLNIFKIPAPTVGIKHGRVDFNFLYY